MTSFYQPEQLVAVANQIAEEACGLDSSQRQDHYQVYCGLVNGVPSEPLRGKLVNLARRRFAGFQDLPDSLVRMVAGRGTRGEATGGAGQPRLRKRVARLLENAERAVRGSRLSDAEQLCRQAIETDPQCARAWAQLAQLLHENLSRFEEAEQAYRKAIEIAPNVAWGWAQLGLLLHENLSRFEEAEQAYRKAVEIDPRHAWAWAHLGGLLHEESLPLRGGRESVP